MHYIVLGLMAIVISVSLTVYSYNDCKKVGHTTLYCLIHLGK